MQIPYIDCDEYTENEAQQNHEVSMLILHSFMTYGCFAIRDLSIVNTQDNIDYINVLEQYFEQEDCIKLKDSRPEYHYQVGITPENTELPRCVSDYKCLDVIEKLDNKPQIPTGVDRKWRFSWKIGSRPKETNFKEFNSEKVIPENFPDWEDKMDKWGYGLSRMGEKISVLLSMALGLGPHVIKNLIKDGPHLLSPTGSNLDKHGENNTILAGFHYDLNLMTLHGKSNYTGLNVWTTNGSKIEVNIPDGYILVQAGKQLEWLTGGKIKAGYHEVLVKSGNKRPKWRVSSTLFLHVASDNILKPLIETPQSNEYEPILAGKYVENELEFLKLKK